MPPANLPLSEVIRSVRLLGAEASLICSSAYQPTNLNGFELPLLSIYQPVAKALQTSALRRVGLIGTRDSAEERLWQAVLAAAGIPDSILPVPSDLRHLVDLCVREFGQGLVTELRVSGPRSASP